MMDHGVESVLLVCLSALIFTVSHSLLATQRCKAWAYSHGLPEPRYRLLYSIIAIVTTAGWVGYIHQLPDLPLYQADGLLWWLLLATQGVGLTLALAAFHPIDGLLFLGLRATNEATDPFIISGIYRYLRHPMYSGAMLIVLAMPEQSLVSLAFSITICIYFIVGSHLEEARMVQSHPSYIDYQQRVPPFFPQIPR